MSHGHARPAPSTSPAAPSPEASPSTDFGANSDRAADVGGGGGGGGSDDITTLSAAAFVLSGGDPTSTGNVTITECDTDDTELTVAAPEIQMHASLDLAEGRTIDPAQRILFGPTQTLLGSDRIGVYRRPGGEEFRTHDAMTMHRDSGFTRDSEHNRVPYPEPFYWQPQALTFGVHHADVTDAHDRPAGELPKQIGDATLVRTEGADRFAGAWTVTMGEQILHLDTWSWSVPWDATVTGTTGTGRALTIDPESTEAPPLLTGDSSVVSAATDWMSFPTVDAALGLPTPTLIQALGNARGMDESSRANVLTALRQRNPTFVATVTVNSTADMLGSDEIALTVSSPSGRHASPAQDIGSGASGDFSFTLADVIALDAIETDTFLVFSAADGGWSAHAGSTASWRFPFAAQEATPMDGTAGNYSIAFRWS